MTIRTDLTVDWQSSPRVIEIAAPSTEITIQDLHDTCKHFEDSVDNVSYEYLIDSAGKEFLGGTTYVGITATLNNAVLQFEARSGPSWILCIISGGNLVAVDDLGAIIDPRAPTAYTTIDRTASASATLQEQGALQYASYGGGVTVDTNSSYSGTEYPVGTPQEPVNNFADGILIAEERGFTTFYVVGDAIIDNANDFDGMIFVGESQTKSELDVDSDASVVGCEFYDATIVGTLDGDCKLKNCTVGTLNYVNGIIEQCLLEVGTITLGGNAEAHFLDCWSGVPGANTPIIDMGGSGQDLSLRNYNGGILIKNKTGSDPVSIDLNSGHVILDSDVTNGEIVIRGIGKLTDNSVGATVNIQDFVNPGTVAEAVWADGKEGILERGIGLMQENQLMDQTVYDANSNLTSARIRIYDDDPDTGNVIATYIVVTTWVGNEMTDYKVTKV